MALLPLVLGFTISAVAALALVPAVRRAALRLGWVDRPDGRRKAHAVPVPHVGGVAILGAVLVGVSVMTLARAHLPETWAAALTLPGRRVIVGALLISAVGFVDDLRDLGFGTKLLAQVAVTALAFTANLRIHLFDGALGDGALGLSVSFALTLVWMMGVMNAVNFIDGLDGLAAGVVGIAFAGLLVVHALGGDMGYVVLVTAILGALAGFLVYNRAPASVFMGDSGSLLLGFLLGAYALRGSASADPVLRLAIPAVVMGVPILEMLVSTARRLAVRRLPFRPDRDHIHHRLQARMSVRESVATLYWLGAFMALGGIAMTALGLPLASVVFALGAGVVYSFLRSLGYLPSPRRLLARLGGAARAPRRSDGEAGAPPSSARR